MVEVSTPARALHAGQHPPLVKCPARTSLYNTPQTDDVKVSLVTSETDDMKVSLSQPQTDDIKVSLVTVDPSFRALSGRLKFTVRRHKSNKD